MALECPKCSSTNNTMMVNIRGPQLCYDCQDREDHWSKFQKPPTDNPMNCERKTIVVSRNKNGSTFGRGPAGSPPTA